MRKKIVLNGIEVDVKSANDASSRRFSYGLSHFISLEEALRGAVWVAHWEKRNGLR